jgi:competence protein ComEA
MATIGITAGPSGPEPADQMASAADGGGRSAAPAEIGDRPRLASRLRARWENLRGSVWLPLALRAATIGTGMIGLAGIGAASIISGLDGRTKIEVPQKADIHAAWVASQSGSAAEEHGHERARAGGEHGVEHPQEHGSAAPASAAGDGGAAREPGITPDGKVILNTASAEEITRLPGVGMRRAEAIVELRTRLKRFRRVQDLLRVKGIGPRSLKRLLPHMVLDAPAPAADAGK